MKVFDFWAMFQGKEGAEMTKREETMTQLMLEGFEEAMNVRDSMLSLYDTSIDPGRACTTKEMAFVAGCIVRRKHSIPQMDISGSD